MKWAPNYSEGLLNLNERILEENLNEKAVQKLKINSAKALKRAPLSYRPFLYLAEANVFWNQNDVARGLFLEAKARNTRSRHALRGLSILSIKEQDYKVAVENLDVLLRLKGQQEHLDSYQQALTSLSPIPQAREAIDGLLSVRPPWGAKYLFNQIALMNERNFSDVSESLEIYTGSPDVNKREEKLNAAYLMKLKRMNKLEEAYRYWEELFGTQGQNAILYNSEFEKSPALPPFNWIEIDRPKYFSEIDQEGGLYASFRDNEARALTEQLLRLKPGSFYRMSVDAEWSYRQRQGVFNWIITCLQNKTVISEVNLDDKAKKNSGGEHTFQVPVIGCSHQNIRLVAKAGQYSKRIWSRTNSVNLERVE